MLNCGFLIYCTTYREVKYPISNKGDPSFINLENQIRFTENAKKRGIKPFTAGILKQIYLGFGLSNLRTIGLSDYWTFGPSDYWTFGLLDLRNFEPSDYWTFGLLDLLTIGPSPY